jgi:aminomethyltransferase
MLTAADSTLQPLPLHDLHAAHGARMAAFAGYEMPVSYRDGVLKEHLHTRAHASLFDVSHMGQLLLRPVAGATMQQAALALEGLLPIDVVNLAPGRQRYGFLTNDAGGIRDDLMIANLGYAFLLIVNAGCKADDLSYLQQQLGTDWPLQALTDRALFALQGPRASAALAVLAPQIAGTRFMDAIEMPLLHAGCWLMRSGYTGEDGFEISAPLSIARRLVEQLLTNPDVRLAGLGARDSLRLEAGLCLHGSDIDPSTTPIEAALEWAIPKARRAGGTRAGGFPGAAAILGQLGSAPAARRIGLRAEQRPVRPPAALYTDESSDRPVGRVTSGGFGPSLNAPVAMGYVDTPLSQPGTRLFAHVREQRIQVTVTALPFVPHRYQR